MLQAAPALADPSPCVPILTAKLVNPCRPLLGAAAYNYDDSAANVPAQIAGHEKRLSQAFNGTNDSRHVDILHTYHTPGQNTLNATDIAFATRPNTLLYTNWKPTETWGDIANQNAAIDSMANSIKSLGDTKIFLTLYHEPEDNVSPGGDANCPNVVYKGTSGTVADYRNMWAYTENRFKNVDGVSNVVWVMNYMSYSAWDCLVPDLYPGDNLIDWITFDPYGTNTTPTFASVTGRFYNLLTADSSTVPDPVTGLTHNFLSKPWGLAEWGITTTTTQEMQFYDDAKAALDAGPTGPYGNLKMYMIFDERSGQSPTGTNRRVGYDDNGSLSPTKGAHYYALANDPKIMGAWTLPDITAPSVPGLTAILGSNGTSANLSWTASTDAVGVTGYKIYRNGGGAPIATITGTTYTDSGLADITTYSYTVAAFDAAGNASAPSDIASVTTPDTTAPSAPSGLIANPVGPTEVDLSWTASTDNVGVTGYQVLRDGTPLTTIGAVTAYTDATAAPQTSYNYTVVALDAAACQSAASNTAIAITPAIPTPPDTTAPSVPTGLSATANADGHQVNLSWAASIDDTAVTGYNVYRVGTTGSIATVTGTTFTDIGLIDATSYTYSVVAIDAAGNQSAPSDSVTTVTPDVTAPSIPGVTATFTDATTAQISWTASTDNVAVSSYKLYRNGDTTIPFAILPAGTTTFTDTNLNQATSYTYTVTAVDAAGNTSVQSVPATVVTPDTTAPSAPTGLMATADASGHSITLTWTAPTDNVGVTGYNVYRGTTLVGAVTDATFTDTGLNDATNYTYMVVATDAAGNLSDQTAVAAATTPDVTAPTAPASVQVTAVGGFSAHITWTGSADNVAVAGYRIYRGGVLVGTTPDTSFTDAGLIDGGNYTYIVTALDTAGHESDPSSSASVSLPDASAPTIPTGLVATPIDGSHISLTWIASTDNVGVAGYYVYRAGTTAPIATTTSTTYTDTNLTDATSYAYTIVVFDAAGNASDVSVSASATTLDTTAPTTPASFTATAQGGHAVVLSWGAATDNVAVKSYNIYRNNSSAPIATVLGTTFTDIGLTDATTYGYTVTAVDAAGNTSSQSASASATLPDVTAPIAPTSLAATAQSGSSIKLTWATPTDNVGVTGYNVYRAGSLVGTTSTLIFTDTGLTNATTYNYTVTALDAASNQSAASNTASATTPDTAPPTTPTGLAATVNGLNINLSWTVASDNVGVVGYTVYLAGAPIGTTAGTSFVASGVLNVLSYTFTVDAYDAAGNHSSPSTGLNVTLPDITAPSTPTGLTATAQSNGTSIVLAWNTAADNIAVTGYNIYRNGAGTPIATVIGTTFTDTGLVSATTYTYTVAAYDAADNTSAKSAVASATTPDTVAPTAPTGLAATPVSASQINLSWTASTDNKGVTGYKVYRGTTLVGSPTGTTYSDTGLTASTAYSYTVRALDAASNQSAASNTASATTQSAVDTVAPTKPTNFKVASVTATSETLTWTASTDDRAVTGYHIYRKGVLIATLSAVLTYTDTGLSPVTAYTYQIDAFDAAGNKSVQATATTVSTAADTTAPTAPTSLTAVTGTTNKTVKLTWTASTDNVAVTGYRIYRGSTPVATVSGSTLTYTDTGLVSGTTYSYHIVAIDAAGNASASSATVSAKAK
ncbi:MAG TPA: fibronectin type III domain-containing protein [Patescibacteria group bacterium]|nr:fibronectin type III domain-containing protein [Patescibacteria group bacterium]